MTNVMIFPVGGTGGGPSTPTPKAATFVVSPVLGVGDYTTIQAALDNLPVEGGYILVREGTYSPVLTNSLPDKPVVIKGCGDSTIIDLGANAIPAFTVPNGLAAARQYVFEDFQVTGTSIANQKIWSIEDANGFGTVEARRINSSGVQYPVHYVDATGAEPATLILDDCHFAPLADGSSILVNTVLFAGVTVNAYMQRVRFYDAFTDSITGALTAGGFFADFTGVNIIGEDCFFAVGTGGTAGAISILNSVIYNGGGGANPIIATADDNFGVISSNLIGCTATLVNFEFAGNGCHVYGGFYISCAFTDSAISFFTDVFFFSDLLADPAVITSSTSSTVKGCYFDNKGTSFVLDGNFVSIIGNRFANAGVGLTAIIRITNGETAVSDNRFPANVVPAILEAGGVAHNDINNNRWSVGPSLLSTTGSFVDGRNVRTITVDTILDNTYETVLVDASGGNVTVTLPVANLNAFKRYNIKKIDATVNTVTIDGDGAETIDGSATQVIVTQYASLSPECDGINAWWIV